MRASLDLPPGSGRLATPEATGRAWWDMSLVRFPGGVMQPVGGWKALPGVKVNGPARAILAWRDNLNIRWVATASLGQIMAWDGTTGVVISPAGFGAGQLSVILDGYGLGTYGTDTYGTHRSLEPQQYRPAPTDTVTLDNWGQNLMAMGSADGRLLQWVPVEPVSGVLTQVANAPTGRTFVVTEERHVMILGAQGDPRRLMWCDQENPTVWTPTITNLAGSLQLRTTGTGLAMRRATQGVLIWCEDDVHLANYIGAPYAYGVQRIGTGCGPAGAEAMIVSAGRIAWMGQQSFWIYDGVVRPLPCPIGAFVFNDINPLYLSQTYGFANGLFPEFTWGYTSIATAATVPDSYVTWNYRDDIWTHGRWNRTIGCQPGAFGLPLLGDSTGQIYQHETGWLDNGNPRGTAVFAETGDIELAQGDNAILLRAIYPDLDGADFVQFHVFGQWQPGDELEDWGVFIQTRTDGIIDVLNEARLVRLRIEGVGDGPWQLGRMKFDAVPGSQR